MPVGTNPINFVYISEEIRQQIEEFICSDACTMSNLSKEDRVALVKQLQRPEKAWAIRKAEFKKLTLENLPTYAGRFGLQVKDIFQGLGYPVQWPTEHYAQVAEEFDSLQENYPNGMEVAQYLVDEAEFFCGEWPVELKVQQTKSSCRVLTFFIKFLTENDRERIIASLPDDFCENFKRRMYRDSYLDFKELVLLSYTAEIPFHWVTWYPPEILYLARHPLTEEFMDSYMRMSKPVQEMIYNMFKKTIQLGMEG